MIIELINANHHALKECKKYIAQGHYVQKSFIIKRNDIIESVKTTSI